MEPLSCVHRPNAGGTGFWIRLIGPRGGELAIDEIGGPRRGRIRLRRGRPGATPHGTAQPHLTHQALDGAPRDPDAFAPQLPPHHPRSVDLRVLVPHAPNLSTELLVAPRPARSFRGILLPPLVEEICRWGDRQHRTNRLDPKAIPMIIDEADHHFARRSSSAWAKYADALPHDLVRAFQSEVLALELRQTRPFIGRQPRTRPGIPLRLAHPPAQRFRCAAQFLGHGSSRGPLGRVLVGMLEHHPHRAFTYLWGVFAGSRHRLHPLSEWAL